MLSNKPAATPSSISAVKFFSAQPSVVDDAKIIDESKNTVEKLINSVVSESLRRFRANDILFEYKHHHECLGLALGVIENIAERKNALRIIENGPKRQNYSAYHAMEIALPFLNADEKMDVVFNIIDIFKLQSHNGVSEIDAEYGSRVLIAFVNSFKTNDAKELALKLLLEDEYLKGERDILLQRVLPGLMESLQDTTAKLCLPFLKAGLDSKQYRAITAARALLKEMLDRHLLAAEDLAALNMALPESVNVAPALLQPVALSRSVNPLSKPKIPYEQLRKKLNNQNANELVVEALSVKPRDDILKDRKAIPFFVAAFDLVRPDNQLKIKNIFLCQLFQWRQKIINYQDLLKACKIILLKIKDTATQYDFFCDLVFNIAPNNNRESIKLGKILPAREEEEAVMMLELFSCYYDEVLSKYHLSHKRIAKDALLDERTKLIGDLADIATSYGKRF